MDDAMDVPLKPVESRRDRTKERGGAESDKRRERDATERRFEKEEREAPRRNHTTTERLGGGDRKERDREYKRRKSSASPPPVNKDHRRHISPPSSRRSPPYKRRREVVFEGGSRRRSFEDEGGRGFANDNRIGKFDGTGLYLPQRMDDHNKLDCANFQGFNMHAYATISYADSRKETLMTYKQFISGLEDDISPKEAQCRYEEYKKEYITTKKRAYFKRHKDDDWLRDKYDPTRLEALLRRRNENAKIQANKFMTELQTCSLCTGPNTQSSIKEKYKSDMDCGIKRRKLSQTHFSLLEHNGSFPVHFECSNPIRLLDDIDLERSLIKKLDSEKGIEANILLAEKDLEFDLVDGGPFVILRYCNHIREIEGAEILEIMRIYLWRVHFVDYYGMIEYKEKPKKNWLKCAPKVKINKSGIEDTIFAEWEKKLETTWQTRLQVGDVIESMLGKDMLQITISNSLDPFVRKIRDEKYGWKYGCRVKGCTKLFHGAEFVHKHLKLKHPDIVTEVILKAQEKLYFQNYMSDLDAPGTNHKASIHLRHSHNSSDKSKNSRRHSLSKASIRGFDKEESNDKQASNETLHPPIVIKCDPNPNEECTRIIENENFNCDDQKEGSKLNTLKASEHTPLSQNFPCLDNARPYISQIRHSRGCFEHLPIDHFMFDHFHNLPLQGIPKNIYINDISRPPQVLMPVLGAGPLGPFVPAPSSIAMRFLIEGPDPFHHGLEQGFFNNNHGQFRNLKIPTPSPLLERNLLNVSSLMIPPHVLHQDPRSIRSYHDLDKSEDEITVIDYRSL